MQAFGWVLVFVGTFALGLNYLEAGAGGIAAPVMITGALLASGGAIARCIADRPTQEAPRPLPKEPRPVCALDGLLAPAGEEGRTDALPSEPERRVLNAAVEALTDGAYSWEQVPQAVQRRWLELLQAYAQGAALDPDDSEQLAGFVAFARARQA